MDFIMDFIIGFFENLWYTIVSIIFIFFIKRWYYKFINKHLSGYKYYLDTTIHSYYRIFKTSDTGDIYNIEVVELNGDLRLRIRSEKCGLKMFSINYYSIPLLFYWDIFWRIVKNILINIIEKKYSPIYSIGLCSNRKGLKPELEKQIEIILSTMQANDR